MLSKLKSVVGEDNVAVDKLERLMYSHDYAPIPREIMTLFKSLPDVVVRPRTPDQLVKVLTIAGDYRVPVTPRGAATWAFGGAMAIHGGIMLDLTRLNRILAFDQRNGLLTVQCGTTWREVLELLETTEWRLPVYPSSSPSATIGGFAATGGLGYGSLKHGYLVDNIMRATVALPTGKVISLRRPPREEEPTAEEVTLEQLFSSEGILCIFLDLTIKLARKDEAETPVLASFNKIDSVVNAARLLMKKTVPFTFIIHDSEFLRAKREAGFHVPDIPRSGGILLGYYSGSKDEVKRSLEAFSDAVSSFGGKMLSEEEACAEWNERFYPIRVKRVGPTLLAADAFVHIDTLLELIDYAQKLAKDARIMVGMDAIAVSPEHAIFLPMFFCDERKTLKFISNTAIVKKLLDFVTRSGGVPYGYGLWNSFHLERANPGRAEELKRLKKRLDPDNILNPGKTIAATTRIGLPLPRIAYTGFLGLMWALRRLF